MKKLPLSLYQLPFLPKNKMVREFSSHNRQGINIDHGNSLYKDEHGDAVLFDAAGPGCLRSFWVTWLQGPVSLKFYFDNEAKPKYEIDAREFFQGIHKDFQFPLVSYECRGYHLGPDSMAGNCFVPISFAKALKISASGDDNFFHRFIWEQFPFAATVKTFPDPDLIKEMEMFFTDPDSIRKHSFKSEKNYDCHIEVLPKNERKDVLNIEEPGVISELVIEAPCADVFLKKVFLCMHWDKKPYLQVQAPIGAFFAVPHGSENVSSLPVSAKKLADNKIRLTSFWPMPFWQGAHIYLDNRSGLSIPDVEIKIKINPMEYNESECGYFTTMYRRGDTEHGRDWLLFDGPGWGHLAGVIQTMNGEHYCEGDEHFYLDNACSPQLNGTGSEDYYLGCFWPNTKFDSPFAGCVYDVYKLGGGLKENFYRLPAAYYRFHLEAPIPFYRYIDARIQHGAYSNIQSRYSSLAICYMQKKIVLNQCDFISTGNEASRSMHKYSASDETKQIEVYSPCEGNYADTFEMQKGLVHKSSEIRFQVAIDPLNEGIKIRRRIDQKLGRQKAKVFLDNEYVGTWYDTEINPHLRWYDSDLDISAKFTSGKSEIDVLLRIETENNMQNFTDFSYTVFCYRF